jgi:hypothetical protein
MQIFEILHPELELLGIDQLRDAIMNSEACQTIHRAEPEPGGVPMSGLPTNIRTSRASDSSFKEPLERSLSKVQLLT